MVIVFINSKLLSADTILPLCISYKNIYPNEKFRFFCVSSTKTIVAIKENCILNRALCLTGKLSDIGGVNSPILDRFSEKSSIFRKLIVCFNLLWTLVHVFCANGKVVHFKFWEHRLLRVFPRIKPKNFVQFHSNCWGDNPEVDAANLVDGRKTINSPLTCFGSVVSFHDYWQKYLDAKALGLPTILAAPTRASDDWLKFLNETCADLIENEKTKIGYKHKKQPVTIVLNTLNQATKCRDPNSPKACLLDTLDALWRICPQRPVLLKPHIITDRSALDGVLDESRHENVHITNMHLAILGQLSSLAICNLFSLGIADCWLSGCPTLEYTNYSKRVLDATLGRSFGKDFIDIFISGESSDLESSIKTLLAKGRIERNFETKGYADSRQLVKFIAEPV